MKKTISSLKIEESTLENMHNAINKFNEHQMVKITIANFRRISIELFSQLILNDKLDEIPIRIPMD